MAFIGETVKGRNFEPGWFLESNVGVVYKTHQLPQSMGETRGDKKIVPMGTVYPSNDASAIGIVYEDIDVTWGDAAGSVIEAGRVYSPRLPVEVDAAAKTALEDKGFHFIDTVPPVTRPY